MNQLGSYTLISLSGGKTLKINGTGGTGHNMFGVTENPNSSNDAFTGLAGYNYYVGDQKFSANVSYVSTFTNGTFVCLQNGKIMKTIAGFGGTGHNMYNISESGNTISSNGSGTQYYVGDDAFSSNVNGVYYLENSTTFGFGGGGRVLKISQVGGTGHNMFNVSEITRGFAVKYGAPNTNYLIGCMSFGVAVTQLEIINNETFIGLGNGKIYKLRGSGGTGMNMFGVTNDISLCGYNYFIGSEYFPDFGARPMAATDIADENQIAESGISIFPNPNNGTFELRFNDVQQISPKHIYVYGSLGNVIFEKEVSNNTPVHIDITNEARGVYFVRVQSENNTSVQKIIKE